MVSGRAGLPPVTSRQSSRSRSAQSTRTCVEIKFYGAFVLNRRVVLHAIDATPARWRGDAGSSPLDRARTAASSPRNDLVKNCRVHPTHWLISTQRGTRRRGAGGTPQVRTNYKTARPRRRQHAPWTAYARLRTPPAAAPRAWPPAWHFPRAAGRGAPTTRRCPGRGRPSPRRRGSASSGRRGRASRRPSATAAPP